MSLKLIVHLPSHHDRDGPIDVREMAFHPSTYVRNALENIREQWDLPDDSDRKRFGLFMMSEDGVTTEDKYEKGWWLDDGSTLDNYLLKSGDNILVKNKIRLLNVKTLDGTKKMHLIDDSKDVKRIVMLVCHKLGIQNPEEYSLCLDPDFEDSNLDSSIMTLGRGTIGRGTLGSSSGSASNYGTMKSNYGTVGRGTKPSDTSTLQKNKKIKDQVHNKLVKMADAKYRKYEKKIFTDDKIQWLNSSETLRQQGIIDAQMPVILRRKFFYSDANVEAHDPVQLNLLYEQCRDSIIKEEYPVTKAQALQLAGIQATIIHGYFNESSHSSGFLTIQDMFPTVFIKGNKKTLEKDIQREWQQVQSTTNSNDPDIFELKMRYVKICRSLKTYGITCFLVKEKEKGKNRMVPRLLGISKLAVYRLDNDTKEILQEWPLESIQRWAAGPKNATLDFGEYQELPYAVKTKEGEGEKIVQLISGYIDIIMESRRAGDKFDEPGQQKSTCTLYSNNPEKAHPVLIGVAPNGGMAQSGKPLIHGVMAVNRNAMPIRQGELKPAQSAVTKPTPHQRPNQSRLIPFHATVKQNLQQIPDIQKKLNDPITGPESHDAQWREEQMDVNRHIIESHLAQTAAETARIINQFPSDENQPTESTLAPAVTGLVSEMRELPGPIRAMASLTLDDPEKSNGILKAADELLNAVSGLLNSAHADDGTTILAKKRAIQIAATDVSNALEDVLSFVRQTDGNYKLVELASNVAHATSELVNNVKTITQSSNLDDPNAPESRLVVAATKSAHAATQLVTVARITAPSIQDPACQQQLADAMKDVSVAMKGIFPENMDKTWLEKEDLDKLRDATGKVSEALAALIGHMKKSVTPHSGGAKYDDLVFKTGELSKISDREELISAVRQISTSAIGPGGLVHLLKSDADDAKDKARQEKLHQAVRSVMQATTHVVEAAKAVAERNNSESNSRLAVAADELQNAAESAIRLREKRNAIGALTEAARQAAAAATQLVAPVRVSIAHNSNPIVANGLNLQNKALQREVPSLVRATRIVTENPDNSSAQQALVNVAEQFLEPAHKTVTASKTAQPTLSDQPAKLMLKNATDKLALALTNLSNATQKAADVCESSPIEIACEKVKACKDELEQLEESANRGVLKPLPGENKDQAASNLSKQVKTTCSVVPQLLTCAAQSDDAALNGAATTAADAAHKLKESVRVSAATGQREDAVETIQSGSAVIGSIYGLLTNARDEQVRDSTQNRQKLYNMARDLTKALNDMLNCLPGQKEIDSCAQSVKQSANRFNASDETDGSPIGSFKDAAQDLKNAAEDTNQAAGNIVGASRGTVHDVVLASSEYAKDFDSLVSAGMRVASHTTGADRKDVVDEMQTVATASNKLLLASKEIACDLNNAAHRQNLSSAAKGVTDAINDLITKCVAAAPGQASCEAALRKLNYAKDSLASGLPPTGAKKDYFTILNDIISDHSKKLGDAMTGMYQHARDGNPDDFNTEVDRASNTLVQLGDDANQAAYIVGISDPKSIPGREGLLNQAEFNQSSTAIITAIRDIQDEQVSQEKLVQAVTVVAKQTGTLCKLCSAAKERAQKPEQRKQFMQAAKDLANATTKLVDKIKTYGGDTSPANRQTVIDATIPLHEATTSLAAFSASPEFSSVPPVLSEEAKVAQKPILIAGSAMLEGGTEMITILKGLIQSPSNRQEWNNLTGSSRKVSESIKQMIQSIREAAPGQKECDDAIDTVNQSLRQLNDASLDAVGGQLQPYEGSLKSHMDDLVSVLTELDTSSTPLANAAKGDASLLGHKVAQTSSYLLPLSHSTIAAASLSSSGKQNDLIDHAKTLGEALLQLIYSAKESGGNPNFKSAHEHVENSVALVNEAISDFKEVINDSPEAAASTLISSIQFSVGLLDSGDAQQTDRDQSDLHSSLILECRALSQITQQISAGNLENIAELTKQSTTSYQALCTTATNANRIADSNVAANSIRSKARSCGSSLADMINSSLKFQEDQDDVSKLDLFGKCRQVTDAVQSILGILSVSSASAQAAHKLTNQIQSIISDLETDILFAQSGTLLLDGSEAIPFEVVMGDIASHSRTLTEDIRSFVRAVETGDNMKLKDACASSGNSISALVDACKLTAKFVAKEGTETQLALLNVAKSVVESLSALIASTRAISGQFNPNQVEELKSSSTGTVLNITKLIKTVQIIREDQSKGPLELQQTVQLITEKTKELDSSSIAVVEGCPEPEELIAATRPLTYAASKAVSVGKSGNTSEILQVCRNVVTEFTLFFTGQSREATIQLIETVVTCASVTESEPLREKVLTQTKQIVSDFSCILSNLHDRIVEGDGSLETTMSQFSHRVAAGISELCRSAQKLKGDGWEDPNDPNVIAEKELLHAAAAIEAAAAKLAQLKPRKEATSKANENLNFDEQILEAAKSIAVATKFLVQAASAAQKELVLQGRMNISGTSRDTSGQFSQGLVSAAQMVAAATGSMCEAANALVVGQASEEKLESAARQVSGATSQLLIACKVKADPDSETMHRLDKAGGAVKRASDGLIKAANDAREAKVDDHVDNFDNETHVQRRRREMEALEEMMRKQRELEDAQRKWAEIQKARYTSEADED